MSERWDGDHEEYDERDDQHAPICPSCGVTALPAEHGVGFVCEHPDCEAFGGPVAG